VTLQRAFEFAYHVACLFYTVKGLRSFVARKEAHVLRLFVALFFLMGKKTSMFFSCFQ